MAESRYTKKETDWLGREKEVHYEGGKKVGETRFTTDWLGRPKQEHFDARDRKVGETRKGSDWLGRERAEHVDADDRKVGYSRNETDWLGRPVQRHYEADSGRQVGATRRTEDWRGKSRKEHVGAFFKASRRVTTSVFGGSQRREKEQQHSGFAFLMGVLLGATLPVYWRWQVYTSINVQWLAIIGGLIAWLIHRRGTNAPFTAIFAGIAFALIWFGAAWIIR